MDTMGPSPEKQSTGDTTSWRLCLASRRGGVRGAGGSGDEEEYDTGGTGNSEEQNVGFF